MKAIIEEQLKNNNAETAVLFVEILNCISSSRTEAELRHQMELLQMRHYQFNDLFKYGFGSSHMWIRETNRRNRLISVEF